jgi:Holliday junction resolvase RusA-like endonuclease
MVTIRGSARMLLSSEARKYKAAVPNIVREQLGANVVCCTDAVRVTVEWYRERRSGDLDKRLGVVFDALQGVLYANDAQVIELVARRHEDPANPRVVITVEAL